MRLRNGYERASWGVGHKHVELYAAGFKDLHFLAFCSAICVYCGSLALGKIRDFS